jgi:hypothetical protein
MQKPIVCLALIVFGVASCKASGEGTDYGGSAASGGAAGGAVGGAGGTVTEAGLDVGVSDAFTDVNPVDTPSNGCPGQVQSFIWIANTKDGTLSKVCTTNGKEVARYFTSPQQGGGDPSRTSVNLHGDMVVTNRDPSSGSSSVTKFAGDIDDCVDRNQNGKIETSYGPTEIKPWGEDECMLWNRPLGGGASIGARATAWDGGESPETGVGGHVYIGALLNKTIYKINGDTGEIVAQAATALGHYGGAIDGKGNLWTVAMGCTLGNCTIERISLADLNDHETFPVHCGYGISIDAKGRVWTAGQNMMAGTGGCVSRFDPATGVNDYVITGKVDFNRGVAVGAMLSAGYVWAASTNGDLIQVNPETLEIVRRQPVGVQEMVGVAIDYEGYVWTVSQGGNAAHKVHPATWDITTVPIGSGPYTYSDMTGMQLRGVVPPPK